METYNLKDQIDEAFIHKLSHDLKSVYPAFKSEAFQQALNTKALEPLGLKQRVRTITITIHKLLQCSYPDQIKILVKVAPHTKGLGAMIFPDFVEVYGLEHFDVSIDALKYFTPFFSSEFAIRHFIRRYPAKTYKIMKSWASDKDPHVRRLASEGNRPRLPWSFKLDQYIRDPAPVLAILNELKSDDSLYVRKSVANSLNDVAKDHPELVLDLAKKWIGQSESTDWVIKHGLRSLLKKGSQKALRLFGTAAVKQVTVRSLKFKNPKAKIGTRIEFEFELINQEVKAKSLRVEYAIHYAKSSGVRSKKVFKLSERLFERGRHKLERSHSLRQMTTRKHFPGKHSLDIVINGEVKISKNFYLV